MSRSRAALAALLCIACVPAATGAPALTLDAAYARTLERHPDLRRLPLVRAALHAESAQAGQAPALVAGASVENLFGSGGLSGVAAAESTLSLASVIERGGKREARIALVARRLDAVAIEQEATRLDILSEVARRYLDALAAQEIEAAATASVAQRRDAVEGAVRRVAAGASPRSTELSAQAALARAQLDAARATETARAARRRLALMWGGDEADLERVAGDLLELPEVAPFERLSALLRQSPELRRFAGEARVREARLQLARSAARADVEWQIGLRRFEAGNDVAMIGSVSIPLGSRGRAGPAIGIAEAELAQLELERESGEMGLRATLAEAHGRLLAGSLAVRMAAGEVLPRLEAAETAAGRAYRAGASSYLEWAQLQADLLAARREQIEAARDFHRALIEIQRLTGDAFIAPSNGASTETLP